MKNKELFLSRKQVLAVGLMVPAAFFVSTVWAATEIENVEVIGNWLKKNSEQSVFEFPGARNVVRAEAFEAQGASTIAEALRAVPGVLSPENTDSSDSSFNLGVRGLQARLTSRTTVLLDGIPLSVAPYGQPHLSLAPTSLGNLSSIDVVKSGGSVRYGPQNVGGILNFNTVEIPDTFGSSIKLRESFYGENANSDDRANLSFMTGGTFDSGLGLALLYSGQHGGGFREHNDTNIDDVILKYAYDLGSRFSLSGRLHYYEADNELPGGLTQAEFDQDSYQSTRPHDGFKGDRKEAVIKVNVDLADDKKFEIITYHTKSFREFTLANVPVSFAGRLDRFPRRYEVSAIEPRYSQTFNWGASQQEMLVGYRFLDEKGREQRFRKSGIPAFGNPDAFSEVVNRDTSNSVQAHSLYVDDKIEFGNWTVTPGIRFERVQMKRTNNLNGFKEGLSFSESLPSLNLLYAYSPTTNFFASYNESFTTQTYAQINRRDQIDNITPERSQIYELGSRYQDDIMGLEATLFMIRFDDIIQYDGSLAKHVNRGETFHRGVELAASWELGEILESLSNWRLRANYTYTKATFEEGSLSGNDLSFYSHHVGSVGLNYQKDRWTFNINTYAQSSQFVDDANTSTDPVGSTDVRSGGLGRIPGFAYTGMQARYDMPEIAEGASITAGVKNLFGKDYYSRSNFTERGLYAGAPRTFYIATNLKF
ncbi:Iron(III) dicitrate transport protein FecA [gamma proteobacterium IMCC2047]|nr:Iron(III) dicitrate transport protein FecA [gamma proteobacterium IMCC2047]